jgi:hypothetical protein
MKSSALLATLLTALFLTACGEKAEEAAAPEAAPAAAPAAEAAPAAAAGGYDPVGEERVPGITRTQEEQDKINAELTAQMNAAAEGFGANEIVPDAVEPDAGKIVTE